MISGGVIASMSVSVLITVLMPLVLAFVWGKKKRCSVSNFIAGAGTFILFVMVLESLCHRLIIGSNSPISSYVNQNKWLYILYAVLAAGIFEETGRYLAFRFVLKREKKEESAVAFGIGHGGIESILIVGIPMAINLAVAVSINSLGGLEAYVAQVPEAVQEATRTAFGAFLITPPADFLIGGIERIAAITLHISLSVLVFQAAKKKGRLWMYPLAIILHALFNIGAALFQTGIVKNIYLVELIAFLIAGACACFAWRIYRQGVSSGTGEEAETGI